MKMPLAKLKAILRYFCSNTNSSLLGKTKLMKLFYFVDFGHVKKFGAPITFDRYIHLENGTIPSDIMNMINYVVDEGEKAILSDTISVIKEEGMDMQKIKCHGEFVENDKKYFSENELETLKEVCNRFKNDAAKKLVDISHSEAPWLKTDESEEIPYALAADDVDAKVDKKEIEFSLNVLSC